MTEHELVTDYDEAKDDAAQEKLEAAVHEMAQAGVHPDEIRDRLLKVIGRIREETANA